MFNSNRVSVVVVGFVPSTQLGLCSTRQCCECRAGYHLPNQDCVALGSSVNLGLGTIYPIRIV